MTTSTPESTTIAEYTRLISLAVHEMRTPASVVGGYLRMLQNDPNAPLSERQRRMIEEAEKSCARLVGILSELSELGKLDAGTATVKADTFDLFELMRDVAANVHESLDREVHLELYGLTTGGPIRGDRARLRTSLDCVVRAVMREQPGSTLVGVESQRVVRDDQLSARIVVAPSPDLRRAAETSPSSFDDLRGGLGLGLPIARRVIARHGGRVWSPVPQDGGELPLGSRGAIVVSLPLLE